MAIADRRLRERAARRRLITATARAVAEREGWDAVTTRRLSTEIEYSQPVLYKHFASMEDIVEAVALEGFGELAETLGTARRSARRTQEVLARVAHAYSSFATENRALYDAMFMRATRLRIRCRGHPSPVVGGVRGTACGSRPCCRRAGCRHPHRGAVGRAARTDHTRAE